MELITFNVNVSIESLVVIPSTSRDEVSILIDLMISELTSANIPVLFTIRSSNVSVLIEASLVTNKLFDVMEPITFKLVVVVSFNVVELFTVRSPVIVLVTVVEPSMVKSFTIISANVPVPLTFKLVELNVGIDALSMTTNLFVVILSLIDNVEALTSVSVDALYTVSASVIVFAIVAEVLIVSSSDVIFENVLESLTSKRFVNISTKVQAEFTTIVSMIAFEIVAEEEISSESISACLIYAKLLTLKSFIVASVSCVKLITFKVFTLTSSNIVFPVAIRFDVVIALAIFKSFVSIESAFIDIDVIALFTCNVFDSIDPDTSISINVDVP